MRRFIVTSVTLFTLAAASSAAYAQKTTPKNTKFLPPVIVKATPPAPKVHYVMDRARDLVKQRALNKRFTKKIVKSVDRAPF